MSLTKIITTPSPATVGINKSLHFTATGYDASNKIVPAVFSWSVSGGIGTIDASGTFYAGSSESSGSVIASAQGVAGSASVSTTTKGSITGILSNGDGGVASGILVYLPAASTISSISDSRGRYTLSNVVPGTWEVDTGATATYVLTSIEAVVVTAESTTGNILLIGRFVVTSQSFVGTPITSVTGSIYNNGLTEAKNVTVSYVFYDTDGTVLSTALGTAGNIASGGTNVFSAFLSTPIDSFTSMQRIVSAGSY